MASEKSKITARMAQLEFDLVMGTAENGDTELLSAGTARTAVETPSVQPRLFENGAHDVFIQ